jgi:hypothetical protein
MESRIIVRTLKVAKRSKEQDTLRNMDFVGLRQKSDNRNEQIITLRREGEADKLEVWSAVVERSMKNAHLNPTLVHRRSLPRSTLFFSRLRGFA